jgi:hypothetical protein
MRGHGRLHCCQLLNSSTPNYDQPRLNSIWKHI